MKFKKLFFVACNLFGVLSFAQVGINTTTPNAQLDIRATSATAPTNTDGLLIPKVDVFPATNPTDAQHGMLVFLTTAVGIQQPGFYYWDNPTTSWVCIGDCASGNNWALAGNTVDATTDFMGSTNDADVIFKRNNVHAGRIGANNTSFGVDALNPASTGRQNTASGVSSLQANTTGSQNTAFGFSSLQANTTGFNNAASGHYSLYSNTTGRQNTASGSFSLQSNTTGSRNTASGTSSLNSNTEGHNNTASGFFSLDRNTTGNDNTASGYYSLYSNTTGIQNTASGANSLYSNTTGSRNTAIGYNAFISGASFSNSTALEANTTITASNQVRLGNNAVTSIGGQVDWTTLSDARFKTENAAKVPGIDFIKKLRPVTYYVDHEAMNRYLEVPKGEDVQNRSSLEAKNTYKPSYTKTLESGFMAQEVEKAAKELGYEFNGVDAPKNDKYYYGLRYGQFVVPLVKAVQELNEKLEQKQAENDQLRAMLLELEKRIVKLEKNASN